MRATEFLNEGWSQKYKSSINCSHPKGFSQKAHCAGKKKHTESVEMEMVCEMCGMCQTHGTLNEIKKGAKDSNGFTKCWPGKHAEGTKKGKNGKPVRNCVPNEGLNEFALGNDDDDESSEDPYKRPKPEHFSRSIDFFGKFEADHFDEEDMDDETGVFKGYWYYDGKPKQIAYFKFDNPKRTDSDDPGMGWYYEPQNEGLTPDEQFDIIEEMVEQLALEHGVDPEVIWEDFDSVDDNELLESAAWRRSAGKSKKGGLNAKGVASYRRENPGSKLQMAVTTKPSKLKAGSKAAKRRKSFCARMGGVKGPMKKPNGKPTRKALALRKWNC